MASAASTLSSHDEAPTAAEVLPSPISSAEPLPSVPVAAPDGALVLAATNATVTDASIRAALDAVRTATQRLRQGERGGDAVAYGMVAFERAVEVPVAFGAPGRAGGREPPECDALLLDSTGRSSGALAVTEVDSPSLLALEIYRRRWGLIAGHGASLLATQVGIPARFWANVVQRAPAVAREPAKPSVVVDELLQAGDFALDSLEFAEPGVGAGAQRSEVVSKAEPSTEPTTETPTAETPTAETPTAETPTAETPTAETPTAETPTAETPTAETPTAETPTARGAAEKAINTARAEAPVTSAVLLLRDGEGAFYIVAEACGSANDPPGQLTMLGRPGTAAFVGEQGAVFVATHRDAPVAERGAERIYRRLEMVQVPKVAAEWGLKSLEGVAAVAIVSRLGSAMVSEGPFVWAKNQSDGEASAELLVEQVGTRVPVAATRETPSAPTAADSPQNAPIEMGPPPPPHPSVAVPGPNLPALRGSPPPRTGSERSGEEAAPAAEPKRAQTGQQGPEAVPAAVPQASSVPLTIRAPQPDGGRP